MQIRSFGDNLHDMLNPILCEKKKKKKKKKKKEKRRKHITNLSSVEFAMRVVNVIQSRFVSKNRV